MSAVEPKPFGLSPRLVTAGTVPRVSSTAGLAALRFRVGEVEPEQYDDASDEHGSLFRHLEGALRAEYITLLDRLPLAPLGHRWAAEIESSDGIDGVRVRIRFRPVPNGGA